MIARTPYFAKIAKGLKLGYYRGAVAGSWVAGFYLGSGNYHTTAIGAERAVVRRVRSAASSRAASAELIWLPELVMESSSTSSSCRLPLPWMPLTVMV